MSTKQDPSGKKEIVFEREFFKIYAWEQEMFDGTKKIFNQIERQAPVSVIAIHNHKIFIAKEFQPHWSEEKYSSFGVD